MNKEIYIIPSLRVSFLPVIILAAIILPVMGFLFWQTLGLLGIAILFVFWLLFLTPLVLFFWSRSKRVEVSCSAISLYDGTKSVVFNLDEIKQIGFQALVSRRMGVWEGCPYLAIALTHAGISMVEQITSFGEYGFITKRQDLAGYMKEENKSDLYISAKFLSEKDKLLMDFLSAKSMYQQSIPPLIKTNSQEEYDKVVSENFES